MSHLLRRISLPRLLVLCVAVVTVGVAATAGALALSGGPTPPSKPLANAIHDALATPRVEGVSANVELVSHLVESSALQTQGAGGGSSSPLLSGASGRLWIASDGQARLELQSEGGATELLWNGSTVTLYDASKNSLYSYTPPSREASGSGSGSGSSGSGSGGGGGGGGSSSSSSSSSGSDAVPSVAKIKEAIAQLMGHANVSGATPTNVAGRPAYSVRISPQRNGGLVGGAEIAWDAVHGVPLQVAIYAKGNPSPVLELTATEVSYGPVPSSVFKLELPSGVKRTEIKPPNQAEAQSGSEPSARGGNHPQVSAKTTGLAAVSAALPFKLSAPEELAGMQRAGVQLIEANGHAGALITYGEGLGGIVLIESEAEQAEGGSSHGSPSLQLPTVTIGGTKATELPTALGTILSFESNGVQHILAGSVTPSVLETAAKGL